jgi:putative aldouronate transport system substrate-binding protein
MFLALTFVGCKKDEEPEPDPEPDPDPEVGLVYADGTELKLAVGHNDKKTTITFQDSEIVGNGLELADGVTYRLDDLKPVWKELEKELKVKFDNVYTAKTVQNEFNHWKSLNFEGVDVLVGNADDIAADGKTGKIVNLAEHLDDMPNFKKFLEDNPIVTLSVISDTDTGAIYFAPYFDGYDDIEKYFLMRTDWLKKLLDGEGAFAATTSDTFGDIVGEKAYEPYMPTEGKIEIPTLKADGSGTEKVTKNYDTDYGNIIEYMQTNVTATTTGVELVNMLRNYIDKAYNGYYGTTRSNLFAGNNASWDADELVALLRCIVTNTFALTGQNVDKVEGIFPRETTLNRTSDLFSFVSLFGVRGYESRNDYLYFDSNGELRDARADVEFAEGINKLNQLYKEKLILQDFDKGATTKTNETMFKQNKGFMIYDYCQTQTLFNETVKNDIPGFNLAPIINPVAKWYDGSNENGAWMRFTESWRSVKTNGWCITADTKGDKLNAALTLFDYMYSEEGNILMSYGPEAWRSGDTISYKGEDIPELSEAALDELWNIAGGNYTNYARRYLGSTLPVGFVKNQGMEYQCTTDGGRAGAEIVSNAIAHDVLKHVTPEISENLFYTMVPTVLPTSRTQDALISLYGALGSAGIYSRASSAGSYNIYTDVLMYGFGSDVALTSSTYITTMPKDAKELVDLYLGKGAGDPGLGGTAYYVVREIAWEKLINYYENQILKEEE